MADVAAPTQYGLRRAAQEASAKAEMARWHVQLLGGLFVASETLTEATSLSFRTHKAALLFARLVLYPHRAHGRDELADGLWPDLTDDKGRANLSQTLHRLKAPFASGAKNEADVSLFTGDHQTVRLWANGFQTDVAVFEKRVREAQTAQRASPAESAARWKAAVDSYSDDLLPGFYDDWIERERQRVRDLFEIARKMPGGRTSR